MLPSAILPTSPLPIFFKLSHPRFHKETSFPLKERFAFIYHVCMCPCVYLPGLGPSFYHVGSRNHTRFIRLSKYPQSHPSGPILSAFNVLMCYSLSFPMPFPLKATQTPGVLSPNKPNS